MYYYVFEQPKNKKIEKDQEKIRTNLEELGIIGELTKANPVQKPEELAKTGLARGYHTLVAVGSDNMVNSIAGLVAAKGATFGIIPIDPDSTFFNLVGVKDFDDACSILPSRRVTTIDIGVIGEEKLFLTQVTAQNVVKRGPKLSLVEIDFGNYQITAKLNKILIQNGSLNKKNTLAVRQTFQDGLLDIYFGQEEETGGIFSKLFGPKKIEKFTSQFHVGKFNIKADPPLEILADSQTWAKTPVEFAVLPSSLKMIVSKDVAAKESVETEPV